MKSLISVRQVYSFVYYNGNKDYTPHPSFVKWENDFHFSEFIAEFNK